jgi:hypothetical protein
MIEWIGSFSVIRVFWASVPKSEILFAYCSVFILGYFIYIVLLRYGAVNNRIAKVELTLAAWPFRARPQGHFKFSCS